MAGGDQRDPRSRRVEVSPAPFWRGGRDYARMFRPFAAFERSWRGMPNAECVAFDQPDLAKLALPELRGFRVTLAHGPAFHLEPSWSLSPDRIAEGFERGQLEVAREKHGAFPSLGLIHIATMARAFGCEVTIRNFFIDRTLTPAQQLALSDVARLQRALDGAHDAALEAALGAWVDAVLADDPQVVGFSALNEADPLTVVLLRRALRARGSALPVALGGEWFTGSFDERLAGEIDILVNGEGEVPFVLACHAVATGEDPSWIPGVCYRNDDRGELVKSEMTHALEVVPTLSLDGFDLDSYTAVPYTGWSGRIAPYRFVVGCPFNCGYCNVAHKGRYKTLEADRIFEDLCRLEDRYGVSQFFFINTAFNVNARIADELLDRIIDSGRRWRWCDCARPMSTEEALYQRLRASGCDWLNWGFDTCSDRLSELYRRRTTQADFARVLEVTARNGIRNAVNVIVGMPHENQADLDALERFMRDNRAHIHFLFLFKYQFIPTSDVGQNPSRYGLHRRDDWSGVDELTGMSWEEREEWAYAALERVKALALELGIGRDRG